MIGSVFDGRYTVNGFLADGPIFTLYSVRDRLTSKDVSLRLIKAPFNNEEPFKQSLVSAIEKTLLVRSAFVERLIEVSSDEENSYVVGELTRAPTLSDRIRKLAPFTPFVAVGCAVSITRGLDAFHKLNIAHGDVSGENIAMLGDGETKLQLGGVWEAYSASKTAGFIVLPTLAPYLAPEISNGSLPTPSSDLYAVGILLYELLTGRKPYLAETGIATAMRHSTEPTPRVRDQNPSIPVVLDEIVFKAMSKDPASRYRSANELIFDLRQTQDALRFGRTLSWPITNSDAKPEPAKKVAVAPRMSAVREPEPPKEKARREKADRDVPVWMLLLFAVVASVAGALAIVTFLIGANRQRLALIPNLGGLTVAEAKANLAPMHLVVRMGNPVASSRYEADRVVSTDPPAGQKVFENSTVVLNLSLGSNQITVPNLKGLTPDKARQMLSTQNLSLDDQIDKLNDPNWSEGTICKQVPAFGAKLARTDKVHVFISDHSLPVASAHPKHYDYHLDIAMPHLDESVQVKIDMTDDEGTRTIFDERKGSEEPISISHRGTGAQATFVIYYNGKEVLRKVQTAGDTTSPSSDSGDASTSTSSGESTTSTDSGNSSSSENDNN